MNAYGPAPNAFVVAAIAELLMVVRANPESFPTAFGINATARQLRDRTFARVVRDTLAKHDLPAAHIGIEIGEDIFLASRRDGDPAISVLRDLHSAGVAIAVTGVGVKHSSLPMLQHLPFDTMKIDRCFVDAMESNCFSAGAVEMLVRLARELGVKVIAEGVEREAQLELVQQLGCDAWQVRCAARRASPRRFGA